MATHTHSLKSFQLRNKTAGDLLLEFSNFGYMWTSVDTKKIVASHIVYSMLELEPFTEFLTIQKWREFVHPHDLYKLIQAEEYVLMTGESTSLEYRLITNRGKNLYVNHHMKLSNSVNGIKLMSIIEDITEQKRGDVILDIMNEGFFELDDNFCFRRLNKHTEKFWNIHRDNFLGKKLTDVFPGSLETAFYKLIINAKSQKRNLIDDVVSPVRNTWVRISVSPYNDGVIVIFYDIDGEKRAQEALRESEEELKQFNAALEQKVQERTSDLIKKEEELKQFNAALEQKVQERTSDLIKKNNILKQAEELSQGGSWVYDINTKKFIWSDGMYALFKVKSDALITPLIYLEYAIPEDKEIAEKIVNSITTNFESFEQVVRIKPDGSIKTIKVKGTPLKNNKGETEEVVGVDIDITEAQQSREKITELNRSLLARNKELNSLNSELNTFTSIAANNYSETLRHLYINLEMIVTNDARNLSNSGRANLRRAQGAIQKMKLTTDDLISFSRLHEIGSKENNVDLTNIVAKVVDDFRNQPGHSLVEINCDHLPFITGYPLLLFQMFHHLIDNAIKFRKNDKGHIVNVTCRESVNGQETDREIIDKNVKYHVISVSDNGIGFPQAESEQLFKLFYRLHDKTKYKGSGTGLALCKRIMEMHGGFIKAEGIPDEGASFHCYFPG